MEVTYSPDIERMDLLVPLSAQLDKLISPRASPNVKARWSMVREPHAPVQHRLSIDYDAWHASTDFTFDELTNKLHMQYRLPHIWGELLKMESDQLSEDYRRNFWESDAEVGAI